MAPPKLHDRLLAACQAVGIEAFNEVQQAAMPRILGGEHVLLIAPTGVGKTEAAAVPIFQRILEDRPQKISCLYITPLRALNRDLLRRMERFAAALGIDFAVRHGDTPPNERVLQSRKPPDFLITTPETLQVMLQGRRLREHLSHVRWVVIDEVHELAEDERGAQLAIALERLVDVCGREFQRIGLSATVGTPEEVARFLAGSDRHASIVHVPLPKGMQIHVELAEPQPPDDELAEKLRVPPENRSTVSAMRRCRELYRQRNATLLFVNTRDAAEFLGSRYRLWDESEPVAVHHGSLSKEVRIQAEEDFKQGRLKALLCTSSLELGIDIGLADFVLQFNSPRATARLVQRVGRSGHGYGRTSEGVVVTSSEDEFAEAAAIARRALAGELEPLRIRQNPLTVLANQIVAIAIARTYTLDEAHAAIRRAYPFRNLTREQFDAAVEQLKDLHLIFADGFLRPARAARPYFYENLSMIPDEKTFRVQNLVTRRVVGHLSESFVVSAAQAGALFIMGGTTWRVAEVSEERVVVEPVAEIGTIPSWIGEEIPVPFEVAQSVGGLRRTLGFGGWPVNAYGRKQYEAYVRNQGGFPVATDESVVVESGGKTVIVNACWGTRINETFGHLLSGLLSARIGESVAFQTDPYRIVLEFPEPVDASKVETVLRATDPEALGPLLKLLVRQSTALRWLLVHVAKKFGAIRRDADYGKVSVERLMKAYEETLLMEEAKAKLLWDRLDVDGAAEVLRRVRDGRVKVVRGRLSPMGKAGLDRIRQLSLPGRPDRATLDLLRRRLEATEVHLLCLHCRRMWRTRVADAPEEVRCVTCESVMIAALGPAERKVAALLGKKSPTEEEQAEVRRLYTNASLVRTHRRRALLALAGRGIGPDTAARILGKYHESEEELLRDILTAEVTYARTRRFWD